MSVSPAISHSDFVITKGAFTMQTMTFDIQGMTCGGCLGSVQRAFGQLDGVSSVGLGFEAKVRSADASEKAAS